MRASVKRSILAAFLPLCASCKSPGPPTKGDAATAIATPGWTVVPADRPLYYERVLTPADLEGRTLRELTLMRNTIYARAGNVFRKHWLHEHFSEQGWYKPTGLDESKLSAVDRENAELITKHETALPREELERKRKALADRLDKDGGALSDGETLELILLSRALGVPNDAVGDELERSPLDDPRLLDEPVTLAQLSDLSRRDLRILRNTIYARRGRAFKSELLQQHFGRMDWYKPDPTYTDARLTPQDKRNVKVVQSVEASVGGPINDQEQETAEEYFEGA